MKIFKVYPYTTLKRSGHCIFKILLSQNPDNCLSVKIEYFPNPIILTDDISQKLKNVDYIILAPLLYDNLSPDF